MQEIGRLAKGTLSCNKHSIPARCDPSSVQKVHFLVINILSQPGVIPAGFKRYTFL